MIASRMLLLFAALLVSVEGCAVFQANPTIADRERVGRALPLDVTLATIASRPTFDKKITVEQELIRRGAYVDGSGSLRDSSGKEIRFFHETPPPGTCPPPRELSPEDLRKQAEWTKFQRDFSVISITWNPSFGPSPP